jgi:hypothetical protein
MTARKTTKSKAAAKPQSPASDAGLTPVPDHYFQDIQGWFNFTLPYLAAVGRAQDGAHLVEVGCWKGRSSAFLGVEILKSGKKVTLHCVDHFLGSDEEVHQLDVELPSLFKLFSRNMQPCVDAGLDLHVHTLSSVDAAAQFKDGSVDFVWLDAGHDYDSVRRDIEAWLPKIKPGGMIGGDDYPMEGVGQAVVDVLGPVNLHVENHWTTWTKEV